MSVICLKTKGTLRGAKPGSSPQGPQAIEIIGRRNLAISPNRLLSRAWPRFPFVVISRGLGPRDSPPG
jgi:hypothetical protein